MVCTYCSSESDVINSRLQKRTNSVWRRRKCKDCLRLFTTIEQVDYEKSWVVQYADESLRPFQREQLFLSMYRSLQHRPDAIQDAISLSSTATGRIQQVYQHGIITSTAVATICLEILQRFDRAAAISYQAFHADVL